MFLARSGRVLTRRLLSATLCGLVACIGAPVHAMQSASETDVKAAFLYKFLSYVEWPADRFSSAAAPIVVGVMDNERVAAALREIASEGTINGRSVAVRSVQRNESLEDLHVLFIGREANAQLGKLVSKAEDGAIMTITETDAARPQRSVIDFLLVDGRVRFAASVPAANRIGARLSSRLLAVAETVQVEAP